MADFTPLEACLAFWLSAQDAHLQHAAANGVDAGWDSFRRWCFSQMGFPLEEGPESVDTTVLAVQFRWQVSGANIIPAPPFEVENLPSAMRTSCLISTFDTWGDGSSTGVWSAYFLDLGRLWPDLVGISSDFWSEQMHRPAGVFTEEDDGFLTTYAMRPTRSHLQARYD